MEYRKTILCVFNVELATIYSLCNINLSKKRCNLERREMELVLQSILENLY